VSKKSVRSHDGARVQPALDRRCPRRVGHPDDAGARLLTPEEAPHPEVVDLTPVPSVATIKIGDVQLSREVVHLTGMAEDGRRPVRVGGVVGDHAKNGGIPKARVSKHLEG